MVLRFLKSCALFLSSSSLAARIQVVDELVDYDLPLVISNQNQLVLNATRRPYCNAYQLQTGNFEAQTCYEVGSTLEVKEPIEKKDEDFTDEDLIMISPNKPCDCSTSAPSLTCDVDATAKLFPPSYIISPYTDQLNLDGEDSTSDAVDISPHLSYVSGSNSSPIQLDVYNDEHPPPICTPHSPVDAELTAKSAEEEVDPVYEMYTKRMKWFDVLSRDRVHGLDTILNKHLGRTIPLESMEPADLSIHYISWSKKAREKLIRSLRSDFELVYVAQSCLSWEALHHQYRKVEIVANSSSHNRVFHMNISEGFKKFQILLERFMEDEHSECQRYSNYVRKRFSLMNLLQVPEVSVHMEEEENDRRHGEDMHMKATQVLKIIDNCIKLFWLFVNADSKKQTWKFRNILWTTPPVEDPRDLELFHNLRKILKKKELWLKNVEGKKKFWLKNAVNPLVRIEYKKDDLLFMKMDLKLVRKVLQMTIISTSQLKWCQEKLNNIDFRHGKISRTHQIYLFPSSS